MLSQIAEVVRRSGVAVGGAKDFSVSVKGTKENLVTSMDVENERFLRRELTALIPGSAFKGEEGDDAEVLRNGYTWIVDPIDGTANFSRGIPEIGISVALMKDGEPFAGVVHNPFNGALYCAQKGAGAYKNGVPIKAKRRPLGDCLFFTAWSAYDKSLSSGCFEVTERLYPLCNDVRRIGTAAVELCMLAEGAGDLFFEARLRPWDYAAASVVLEEAGGCIRSLGAPLDYEAGGSVLAAGSPENLDVLEAEVRRAFPNGIPRRSLLQQLHGGDVLDGLVLEREERVVQSERGRLLRRGGDEGVVPRHANLVEAQVMHPQDQGDVFVPPFLRPHLGHGLADLPLPGAVHDDLGGQGPGAVRPLGEGPFRVHQGREHVVPPAHHVRVHENAFPSHRHEMPDDDVERGAAPDACDLGFHATPTGFSHINMGSARA